MTGGFLIGLVLLTTLAGNLGYFLFPASAGTVPSHNATAADSGPMSGPSPAASSASNQAPSTTVGA